MPKIASYHWPRDQADPLGTTANLAQAFSQFDASKMNDVLPMQRKITISRRITSICS